MFPRYNGDSPNTILVAGTTSGGDSNADLVCFWGSSRRVIASNVPVSSGSFSINAQLFQLTVPGAFCVLRAIPTGDTTNYPPGSPSAFGGPRIGAGYFSGIKIGGTGPNQDVLADFDIRQPQSEGYMDYLSAGFCGLDFSTVFAPITFAQSDVFFFCNGWLWYDDGCTTATANCTQSRRSELQVDGNNAYLPGSAKRLYNIDATHASDQLPGYPALTFDHSADPLNGNVNITESDPVVVCSPSPSAFHSSDTDPAWTGDCSSFVSAGVKLDRTISQDHDGRVSTIRDTWMSTDGTAHQIDALYDERFAGDVGTNPSPTYLFPWRSQDYQHVLLGQLVPGPASGPMTVYIDGNGAAADVFAHPVGAVTYSTAPSEIRWYEVFSDQQYGVFRFIRTVPATGSLVINHAYADGSSKAEVAALAAANEDAVGIPTIAITAPADGSTASNPAVTVTGTSSDPGGAVKSVTVNRTVATLAPDGTWSVPLMLAPGANTITALAADAAGNTGSAQETLTFTPPDKTPPVLALAIARIKLAALIRRGLPVTVGCSEACSFRVDLILSRTLAKKLHAARVYSIGRKTGTLTTAGKKKVRVKLTRKAVRALRKAKKLRKLAIKVRVVAKDGVGNVASKTKKVTVRR